MSEQTVEAVGINPTYAKLGLTKGWQPTGVQQLRWLLLGPPGCGKTTLVMSNPKAVVFDCENRANDVLNPQAAVLRCTKIKDILDVRDQMLADAERGVCPFEHVVFDTSDAMIDLCIPYLNDKHDCLDIREYGARGAGWFKIKDLIMGIAGQFARAGFGWTLTGHINELSEVDDKGNVKIRRKPSSPPSLVTAVYSACHVEACMIRVFEEVVVGERPRSRSGKPLKGGRAKTETRAVFILNMTPKQGQTTKEVKNPYLPFIEATIHIPASNGWTVVEKAYEKAIKKARDFQAQSPEAA